ILFSNRKIFPIRFILRHYPIRGQTHGLKKVFFERKGRILPSERAVGWHRQYDHIGDASHFFLFSRSSLSYFNLDEVRRQLISGAEGPGMPIDLAPEFTKVEGEAT